jgi:maleate cis-trans isomerase
MTTRRFGMIVPSSNATMEAEIPALLRALVIPVVSSAAATVWQILRALEPELVVLDAGPLLAPQ